MKIVIDAGHGGSDLGAKGLVTYEKDINLYASLVLCGFFKAYGHEVNLTRTDGKFVTLKARVEIANNFSADLFLSLHCNGNENPKYQGIECYTSPGETGADAWARKIQTALLDRFTGHKDFAGPGTSEENFYVLKNTRMAAVLIEMEFITNFQNERFLNSMYPEIAETIAKAVGKSKGK